MLASWESRPELKPAPRLGVQKPDRRVEGGAPERPRCRADCGVLGPRASRPAPTGVEGGL